MELNFFYPLEIGGWKPKFFGHFSYKLSVPPAEPGGLKIWN